MTDELQKCTFVIATTAPDNENWQFTESALNDIARDAPGKQIYLDFDPKQVLGQCLTAQIKGTRVVCEGMLPADVAKAGLFVAPSITAYRYHKDDGLKVIDYCKLVFLSVVGHPADAALQPVKPEKKVKRH